MLRMPQELAPGVLAPDLAAGQSRASSLIAAVIDSVGLAGMCKNVHITLAGRQQCKLVGSILSQSTRGCFSCSAEVKLKS
jgi:hypothetical protein